MNSLPIGDYALLSDCRSAALVSRAGSVDWLCWPRFDSPAVFARILDPDGGHFAIRPAGDFQASRAYVDQTMTLETTFGAQAGTAVLTDAMAVGRNDRGHHLGAGSPGVLLRWLKCTAGEIDVDVSYAPRPEYGLIHPILEAVAGGIAAHGGASRLLLSAPAGLQVADEGRGELVVDDAGDAAGEIDGADGERLVHGHAEVARAQDAALVAEGFGEGLAEGDADVFDRVVLVDVEVADALELEVEAAVAGEAFEHVVEEADAGGDGVLAGAVDVEAERDFGFERVALDSRDAGFAGGLWRDAEFVNDVAHRRFLLSFANSMLA